MPTAILKYSLPEEQEEFNTALHGIDYKIILCELDQALRQKYKYEDQETIKIEEVRQMISDMLVSRNVDLY